MKMKSCKIKLDDKNSVIPIHWKRLIWKWLLLSILKQLEIIDNDKYKDTELYKKIIEL